MKYSRHGGAEQKRILPAWMRKIRKTRKRGPKVVNLNKLFAEPKQKKVYVRKHACVDGYVTIPSYRRKCK